MGVKNVVQPLVNIFNIYYNVGTRFCTEML
jgi:hypothetical protein